MKREKIELSTQAFQRIQREEAPSLRIFLQELVFLFSLLFPLIFFVFSSFSVPLW
jgi:hypothetical protein